MKTFLASSLIAVLGLLVVAHASASPRLQGSQCLDPNQARSWIDQDNNEILVDAGRYKYRIHVASACTALGYTQNLVFRGDPVSGRVCGGVGDAILTRDYPCKIEAMELLSKEQYKLAMDDRAASVKARRAERKARKSN